MYDELNARSQTNRGSRPDNSANNHPATRRTYLLRGMVLCGCGRRMEGGHRHGRPYYRCAPRGNNRGRPDKYGDHDKTVFIREDHLLDGVARFFADRVLGENRHSMLRQADRHHR